MKIDKSLLSGSMARFSLRRLRWRTRVILDLVCVVLAVALWYALRGFPYLSGEQDLQYGLRRSLAHNADIIYSERVPDGLGMPSTDETVYIVRWQDTVGVMSMLGNESGNADRYVQKYPNRDGLFIILLYGALPTGENGMMRGWTVAVAALDPAVERVEVIHTEPNIPPSVHLAEPAENGVFIAEVDIGYKKTFGPSSVYIGALDAYNYLGAVAYDGDGNVVARTASEWEERYYENR